MIDYHNYDNSDVSCTKRVLVFPGTVNTAKQERPRVRRRHQSSQQQRKGAAEPVSAAGVPDSSDAADSNNVPSTRARSQSSADFNCVHSLSSCQAISHANIQVSQHSHQQVADAKKQPGNADSTTTTAKKRSSSRCRCVSEMNFHCLSHFLCGLCAAHSHLHVFHFLRQRTL